MFLSGLAEGAGSAYDCLVIGSGPAGVTVALELGRSEKKVLMLEAGSERPGDAQLANSVGYGHYSGNYWNGHSVRGFGGTSNLWNGWCTTPREIDFDNPSVGVKWPIARSDLLPYYRRAAPILDRDPSIVDFERPLFPGFSYRPFSQKAPTRFAAKYEADLRSSANVHVAFGCPVVALEANDARSAVRAVRCYLEGAGNHHALDVQPAQTVVLAAGGLGNAQLLLQPPASGGVPVGNESGHVGKFLMEHPHFYAAAECVLDEDLERLSPPAAFGPARHTLVPDAATTVDHGLLGSSLQCTDQSGDHEIVDYLEQEHGRPFFRYSVDLRTEMLPSADNRVFLTGERDRSGLYRPAARCVLQARDWLNAELTLRIFGERLIAEEKGRVRINNDVIYGRLRGGGHIMGTTRMGVGASDSVVDSQCRVHGYANLHVAGSSVFPTGGYANPTLTIVALALRLADALKA
jgi:choline dehydrogenase-like flavoprotein